MLNLKQKRFFVCSLVAAFLLSVAAASVANAREVDVTFPPALDESGQAPADTPNLIMTWNGTVTEPDNQSSQPNLYQAQDNLPVVDDNSTRVIAQNDNVDSAEQNNLVTGQASLDFSVLIAGCLSLLIAAVAVGVLVFVRRRRVD